MSIQQMLLGTSAADNDYSVFFDGDDDRLTFAATGDFAFGTGDFTLECFAKRAEDNDAYSRLMHFGPYWNDNDSNGIAFDDGDHADKITFSSYRNINQGDVPSNGRVLISNSSVYTGKWYHVAITRVSGVFRLFINGILEDTDSSITSRATEASGTNTLAIAGTVDRMVSEPFDGNISNLRVVKGTDVYFKDDYSVDFDGSGDDLSFASSSDFGFGTGDFTFEAWIKPDNWSSTYITLFTVYTTGGIFIGKSGSNFVVRSYNNANHIETTNFPEIGQWTHVAVTRSGSTLKLFFNGTEEESASTSYDFVTGAAYISNDNYNNRFVGEISNLRIVKGTAVYTSSFKPPTEPLTNITNTKLLCCNGDSTTSSTVTPGTITANGDPTVSVDSPFSKAFTPPSAALTDITNTKLLCCNKNTVTGKDVGPTITADGAPSSSTDTPFPFEPEYSVDFDGSNDKISIPDSSDFEIDGTNFTLECWFKADDVSGGQAIAGQWVSGGGTERNFDFYLSGSTLYFENCRGSTNYSVSTSISAGQWYHIAGVLNGTTLQLFVDGSSVGTTTVSGSANNSSANFGIGGYATGTAEEFNGQISNVRFVKGQALYTSNFTAPTGALTLTSEGATASNVKLLCCNKNTVTDSTKTPGTITNDGAKASADSPF